MRRKSERAGPLALGVVVAAAIAPSASLAQDLVLVHANVVDVTDGSVREDATVVIRDGRIVSIEGPGSPTSGPVVDVQGMYLSPGLIDAHVHIDSFDQAGRALRDGVTTARSMGSNHYADVGLRTLVRDGNVDAPEILGAGYHVRPTPAEGFFLDHPEMARYMGGQMQGPAGLAAMAEALLSRGVDFIKVNATERAGLPNTDPRKQFYDVEEMSVLVRAADAAGAEGVAAHAHGDEGGRAAVEAGVRSIEHGTYLSPTTLRMMAERGTYLVPTVAIVRDLTIPGGDYDNAVLQLRGRHMLPRVREMVTNAHALGVRIVAATDTGYGPNGVVRLSHELEEFVSIGMSPLEALQAATTTAAELLGLEMQTGHIATGLDADLIVTERNPLEDIGALQDVLLVVNNGHVVMTKGDWFANVPVS